jgi:beta-N-acetylhexosaminidase
MAKRPRGFVAAIHIGTILCGARTGQPAPQELIGLAKSGGVRRQTGISPARLWRGPLLVGALVLALACGSKRAPASPVTIVTQTVSPAQLDAGGTATAAGTAPVLTPSQNLAPATLAAASATVRSNSTPGFGPAPAHGTPAGTGGVAPSGLPAKTPIGQAGGCVDAVYRSLSPEQQIGQLFMVGLSSAAPRSPATAAAIHESHAGNVVLYGTGGQGAATVKQTADWLKSLVDSDSTGGVGLFISGNQEGGQQGSLQAFYGPGFDAIPPALTQGRMPPPTLQANAQLWGSQLRNAGINLDLAPVLDTVNMADAATNAPIGALQREYGTTPEAVARAGVAFIAGMHDAGEAVAIKHFPGLGRVTGNTDFTAQGITDSMTTTSDAYLQPYRDGIAAGAEFMMISLATYTQIDPGTPAVFSRRIVTDLLRSQLGFPGVILSDDLGAAAAVAGYPPAQRALNFFRAGGDMVLTIEPSDIASMTQAVLGEMQRDPAFAQRIADAVHRVLNAKKSSGLLPACAGGDG